LKAQKDEGAVPTSSDSGKAKGTVFKKLKVQYFEMPDFTLKTDNPDV
jgi:hypothetical protein